MRTVNAELCMIWMKMIPAFCQLHMNLTCFSLPDYNGRSTSEMGVWLDCKYTDRIFNFLVLISCCMNGWGIEFQSTLILGGCFPDVRVNSMWNSQHMRDSSSALLCSTYYTAWTFSNSRSTSAIQSTKIAWLWLARQPYNLQLNSNVDSFNQWSKGTLPTITSTSPSAQTNHSTQRTWVPTQSWWTLSVEESQPNMKASRQSPNRRIGKVVNLEV